MKLAIRLGVCLVLSSLPLSSHASGGGGGGGGDMPSASAPAYDPNLEYQKGLTALRAGDFKSAEKAFNRVLSVIPKDANTSYLLGVARTGLSDYKGALKAYQKAVKADPNLIAAHQQLALTHLKLGSVENARAERELLAARALTCGDTCAENAELKAAISTIDSALAQPTAVSPSPKPGASLAPVPGPLFGSGTRGDAAYLAAVSFINEGKYDLAIQSLETASAALGPHPDILTYRGYVARKTGDFRLAETYYQQALRIAPNHRGANEYYGELKVMTGDMAGARQLLARLDTTCGFGCAEAEELRRWIEDAGQP